MKIIHLVTSLDFGGLERRMEILSKYPSTDNNTIFVALAGGGKTAERLKANKSQVFLLEQKVKIPNIKTLLVLRRFFKEQKPDVIHCHGCEANFFGVVASRLLGIKLVLCEEIGISGLSFLSKIVFKTIYAMADTVICMSPAVRDFFIDTSLVQESKLKLVYNPVMMSEYPKNWSEKYNDELRFVYLGRLEKVKNPDGLLIAFNKLILLGEKAHLTICGDGSMRNEVELFISDNNLQNHITFLGFVDKPLIEIIKHDVLIQPSHTEGFSLALAEAMSCRVPALCTPSGSALDLIIPNESGWIADSSQAEDLYLGMIRVLSDRAKLSYFGSNARNIVLKNHSPTEYSKKLDLFYAKEIHPK